MLEIETITHPPTDVTLRVLLFAFVAATSPLALASVLVVLTSERARLNGSAFAVGFVAGQATVCLLALTIGTWSFPSHAKHHAALEAFLTMTFGGALLVAAAYFRRHRREAVEPPTPNPRAEAVRARLSTLRPTTALGTGAALGVAGPKRLAITLVATATITTAGVRGAQEFVLAALYVLVATALVWVPVLLYIVLGHRAATWLTQRQAWIGAHKEPLTFYPSAVLGLLLIADGIVQLTA